MSELFIYHEQFFSQILVHPSLILTFLLSSTSYCFSQGTLFTLDICSFPKVHENVNAISSAWMHFSPSFYHLENSYSFLKTQF